MRHRRHFRRLNRTFEHRWALRRNMAQNLIEHGRLETTLAKAKNLVPFVDRLLTLAVKSRRMSKEGDSAGALRLRRRIEALLGPHRSVLAADKRDAYFSMTDAQRTKTMRMATGRRHRTGEPRGRLEFTAESLLNRLVEKVASRYESRPGGYAQIIRTARTRVGDSAPITIVRLVGDETPPTSITKPGRSARKRRADSRYALAVKVSKSWSAKSGDPARATSGKPPSGQSEPAESIDADPNAG